MRKILDKYIGHFLALLMAIMLISVVWQVFTRYIMGSSSDFTDELARYTLIWIGMLGSAYISGQNMHLAIDLLPDKVEGKSKYWLSVFINLLIILFASVVMILGGSRLVYITYTLGQTSAALQVPLSFIYMILPLSGILIMYYKINDILNFQVSNMPGSQKNEND